MGTGPSSAAQHGPLQQNKSFLRPKRQKDPRWVPGFTAKQNALRRRRKKASGPCTVRHCECEEFQEMVAGSPYCECEHLRKYHKRAVKKVNRDPEPEPQEDVVDNRIPRTKPPHRFELCTFCGGRSIFTTTQSSHTNFALNLCQACYSSRFSHFFDMDFAPWTFASKSDYYPSTLSQWVAQHAFAPTFTPGSSFQRQMHIDNWPKRCWNCDDPLLTSGSGDCCALCSCIVCNNCGKYYSALVRGVPHARKPGSSASSSNQSRGAQTDAQIRKLKGKSKVCVRCHFSLWYFNVRNAQVEVQRGLQNGWYHCFFRVAKYFIFRFCLPGSIVRRMAAGLAHIFANSPDVSCLPTSSIPALPKPSERLNCDSVKAVLIAALWSPADNSDEGEQSRSRRGTSTKKGLSPSKDSFSASSSDNSSHQTNEQASKRPQYRTRFGHMADYFPSSGGTVPFGSFVGLPILREYLPSPSEWSVSVGARDDLVLVGEMDELSEKEAEQVQRVVSRTTAKLTQAIGATGARVEDEWEEVDSAEVERIEKANEALAEVRNHLEARWQRLQSRRRGVPPAKINLHMSQRLKAGNLKYFTLKTGRLKRYDTTSGFFVEMSYNALVSGSFGFLFLDQQRSDQSFTFLGPRACVAVSSVRKTVSTQQMDDEDPPRFYITQQLDDGKPQFQAALWPTRGGSSKRNRKTSSESASNVDENTHREWARQAEYTVLLATLAEQRAQVEIYVCQVHAACVAMRAFGEFMDHKGQQKFKKHISSWHPHSNAILKSLEQKLDHVMKLLDIFKHEGAFISSKPRDKASRPRALSGSGRQRIASALPTRLILFWQSLLANLESMEASFWEYALVYSDAMHWLQSNFQFTRAGAEVARTTSIQWKRAYAEADASKKKTDPSPSRERIMSEKEFPVEVLDLLDLKLQNKAVSASEYAHMRSVIERNNSLVEESEVSSVTARATAAPSTGKANVETQTSSEQSATVARKWQRQKFDELIRHLDIWCPRRNAELQTFVDCITQQENASPGPELHDVCCMEPCIGLILFSVQDAVHYGVMWPRDHGRDEVSPAPARQHAHFFHFARQLVEAVLLGDDDCEHEQRAHEEDAEDPFATDESAASVLPILQEQFGLCNVHDLPWLPTCRLQALPDSVVSASLKDKFAAAARCMQSRQDSTISELCAAATDVCTSHMLLKFLRLSELQTERVLALGVRNTIDIIHLHFHEWMQLQLSDVQLGKIVAIKRKLFKSAEAATNAHDIVRDYFGDARIAPSTDTSADVAFCTLMNIDQANEQTQHNSQISHLLKSAHWQNFVNRLNRFSVTLSGAMLLDANRHTGVRHTLHGITGRFQHLLLALAHASQPEDRFEFGDQRARHARIVDAALQLSRPVLVRTLDVLWTAVCGFSLCSISHFQRAFEPSERRIGDVFEGAATAVLRHSDRTGHSTVDVGIGGKDQGEDYHVPTETDDADDVDEGGGDGESKPAEAPDSESDGSDRAQLLHSDEPVQENGFISSLMSRTDVKHAAFSPAEVLAALPRPDKFVRCMAAYAERCASLRLVGDQVQAVIMTVHVRLRGIAKSLVVPAQYSAQTGLNIVGGQHQKRVMLVGLGAQRAQAAYYDRWRCARRQAAKQLIADIAEFYSPVLSKCFPRQMTFVHARNHLAEPIRQPLLQNRTMDDAADSGLSDSKLQIEIREMFINVSVQELNSLMSYAAASVARQKAASEVSASTDNLKPNLGDEDVMIDKDSESEKRKSRRVLSKRIGGAKAGGVRCWLKLPQKYHHLLSVELWNGRTCIGRFSLQSVGQSTSSGSTWALSFPTVETIPITASVVVKLLPIKSFILKKMGLSAEDERAPSVHAAQTILGKSTTRQRGRSFFENPEDGLLKDPMTFNHRDEAAHRELHNETAGVVGLPSTSLYSVQLLSAVPIYRLPGGHFTPDKYFSMLKSADSAVASIDLDSERSMPAVFISTLVSHCGDVAESDTVMTPDAVERTITEAVSELPNATVFANYLFDKQFPSVSFAAFQHHRWNVDHYAGYDSGHSDQLQSHHIAHQKSSFAVVDGNYEVKGGHVNTHDPPDAHSSHRLPSTVQRRTVGERSKRSTHTLRWTKSEESGQVQELELEAADANERQSFKLLMEFRHVPESLIESEPPAVSSKGLNKVNNELAFSPAVLKRGPVRACPWHHCEAVITASDRSSSPSPDANNKHRRRNEDAFRPGDQKSVKYCCQPAEFLLKAEHSSSKRDTFLCDAHFRVCKDSDRGKARTPTDVSGRSEAVCRSTARLAASEALLNTLTVASECWMTVSVVDTQHVPHTLVEFRTGPHSTAPHVAWSQATPHPVLQREAFRPMSTSATQPGQQHLGRPMAGHIEAQRSPVWDDFALSGNNKIRICSAPSVFFISLHNWHRRGVQAHSNIVIPDQLNDVLIAVRVVSCSNVDAERVRWINAVESAAISWKTCARVHKLLWQTDRIVADAVQRICSDSDTDTVDINEALKTSCNVREVSEHLKIIFEPAFVRDHMTLVKRRLVKLESQYEILESQAIGLGTSREEHVMELSSIAENYEVLFHCASLAFGPVPSLRHRISLLRRSCDVLTPLTKSDSIAVFHRLLRPIHVSAIPNTADSVSPWTQGDSIQLLTSDLPLLLRATDWACPLQVEVVLKAIDNCQLVQKLHQSSGQGVKKSPTLSGAWTKLWTPPTLPEVLHLLHPSFAGCPLLREYATERLAALDAPSWLLNCILPQIVHSFRWESTNFLHKRRPLAALREGLHVLTHKWLSWSDSSVAHRQYNALHGYVLLQAVAADEGFTGHRCSVGLTLFWILQVETSAVDDSLAGAGIHAVEHRAFCSHLLRSFMSAISNHTSLERGAAADHFSASTSLRPIFEDQMRLWSEHGLFARVNEVVQLGGKSSVREGPTGDQGTSDSSSPLASEMRFRIPAWTYSKGLDRELSLSRQRNRLRGPPELLIPLNRARVPRSMAIRGVLTVDEITRLQNLPEKVPTFTSRSNDDGCADSFDLHRFDKLPGVHKHASGGVQQALPNVTTGATRASTSIRWPSDHATHMEEPKTPESTSNNGGESTSSSTEKTRKASKSKSRVKTQRLVSHNPVEPDSQVCIIT